MPPRRQTQLNLQQIEMNELRRQIQDLQQQLEAQRVQQGQNENPYQEEEFNENPFHEGNSSSSEGEARHPYRRPANQFSKDLGIKIEIPNFEGRLQPDDFQDWLHTVERVFDLKDIPSDQRVKLVAIKLRKHASIWWENLKRQRERDGRSKIRT